MDSFTDTRIIQYKIEALSDVQDNPLICISENTKTLKNYRPILNKYSL